MLSSKTQGEQLVFKSEENEFVMRLTFEQAIPLSDISIGSIFLGSASWQARFVRYLDKNTIEAQFREADILQGSEQRKKLVPIINFSYMDLNGEPTTPEVVELQLN